MFVISSLDLNVTLLNGVFLSQMMFVLHFSSFTSRVIIVLPRIDLFDWPDPSTGPYCAHVCPGSRRVKLNVLDWSSCRVSPMRSLLLVSFVYFMAAQCDHYQHISLLSFPTICVSNCCPTVIIVYIWSLGWYASSPIWSCHSTLMPVQFRISILGWMHRKGPLYS